ncbi:MAG: hypothetical protein MUE41_03555 [Gemmatimonadaceae bacterium]|jgi:hypothetical protein|nr:hypothetical protein [Gemmatimonadaceae bacterium]
MLSWLAAIVVGAVAFRLAYPARPDRWTWIAAIGRGGAAALLTALLLDAPAARGALARPIVVVDGSASMGRGGDALWRAALDTARALGASRLAVVSDSVRTVAARDAEVPQRGTLALGGLVETALRDGVPVTFVSDGELAAGAADVLAQLPPGSRTIVVARPRAVDLAVEGLEVDEPLLAGDTARVRVHLRSGPQAVDDGVLRMRVGDAPVLERRVAGMGANDARTVELRMPLGAVSGDVAIVARAVARGDVEARNDSAVVRAVVTDQPRAVVVITSPDPDMRYALDAWRGALGEQTRAYLRIAPGQWRDALRLTPVAESQVRSRARAARTLVLQGDTTWAGPLSEVAASGVLLVAPPPLPPAPRAGETATREEWYAMRAPASPVSAVLSGAAWDSLPPIAVGRAAAVPPGGGVLLEAALGRRGTAQPVASWRAEGRRRVATVVGRGFAGWAVRGGGARDVHDAFWGGIAGWIGDAPMRAVAWRVPAQLLREDRPITWSLPGAVRAETLRVRESARAADVGAERVLPLLVDSASAQGQSGAPPAGDYVGWIGAARGAPALRLTVNPSSELVPASPSLSSRAASGTTRAAAPVGVTRMGLVFGAAVVLLCIEWLARRQAGLR